MTNLLHTALRDIVHALERFVKVFKREKQSFVQQMNYACRPSDDSLLDALADSVSPHPGRHWRGPFIRAPPICDR